MEAIHPHTKKPIKIIKTEAHLYRNKKTLIWLRAAPEAYPNPSRYKRWYSVVTSTHLAEQWHQVLGTYPSAIILETPTEATISWLQTKAPKTRELLFLSKAVMSHYGKDRFTKEGFVNVVCLEELGGMFPHTLRSYVQGDPRAITVSMIAAIFRVQLFHGLTQQERCQTDVQTYLTTLQTTYGLNSTDTPLAAPEELWLIQQYFVPNKPKRAKEINRALQKNTENPFIDKILLLNEEFYTIPIITESPKIQQIIVGKRLRYADVILTIQDLVPSNTIIVFSNSDIYLDAASWQDVWSVSLENTFLSLLRYEEPQDPNQEPQLFGPRPDSQDTWVVHSSSVQSRKGTWDFEALNFPFGKAGCDNAINIEMLRKKFVVANPALSLKTIHCHASKVRTYDQDDVVEKPMFLYLDPTGLHDLQPLQNLPQPASQLTHGTLKRHVKAQDPKALKTFCKATGYEANSPNLYDPPKQAIYQFENAFVTPNGLVYGYDKLMLGKNQAVRAEWTTTTISHMTPAIGVKSILAAPLDQETTQNLWAYTAVYLSKILLLRANGYKGDMWMPPSLPRLQEFLQHFKWEESVLPVLPHDLDLVGFGERVTYVEKQDLSQPTQEEVAALRTNLKSYEPNPIFSQRVVIFQDDNLLTADDTLLLESTLEEAGFEVNIVYPHRSSPSFLLQRTLGCAFAIATPGTHNLFWLLPKGTQVLDLIPEVQIHSNAAHMAGASGLEYWLALLPRTKHGLLEQVMKSMTAMAAATSAAQPTSDSSSQVDLPLVTIPEGFKDFHGHKGDSFREMVQMWRDRGWIRLETTAKSPFVWWGAPGDTLLYDRATWDWLDQVEPKYSKLLAGNPDPSKIPRAQVWSFWPRHPKALEAFLETEAPVSYAQRQKTLVFYGKIENQVQAEHRSNALHEACDDFAMPTDAAKPHTYSQAEYLTKLASAKFGLCLAGFGPKCNREIECMALGTVPVVAPDVDMSNYINPPQEGTHYIRLTTFEPQEVKDKLSQITETKWSQLSAAAHEWWKQNASCEGLFNLTKSIVSL